MSDKAAGQKTRSPEGCDENGPAAALLLSHVSIQICSFVAPCRRPILIATPLPQSLTWCTSLEPIANRLADEIEAEGFHFLAITSKPASLAGSLNHPHPDPFDGGLIAQALIEGLALVTHEALFDSFGITRLW